MGEATEFLVAGSGATTVEEGDSTLVAADAGEALHRSVRGVETSEMVRDLGDEESATNVV